MREGFRLMGMAALLGLFLAAGVVGCGGKGGLEVVPVSGKVILPGGPVAGVGVSFRPDASKGNKAGHIAVASTDAEGKYELITAGARGAPPGWYKVVVTPPSAAPVGGEMPKAGRPPFALKYTDEMKTDLHVEVKAGAPAGSYDLKLEK